VCLANKTISAGGGNGPIMVRMFVCLCLASEKPSEQAFFVPSRTDFLGVKLLNHYLYIIPTHRVTHCLDHAFPISLINDTRG
jgi:hypothetical protein